MNKANPINITRIDHVCFLLDPWETDTVLAHLYAHGVETGKVASRYGSTGQGPSIYLRDPEGNSIELKSSGP